MSLKGRPLHRLLLRASLSGAHLFAWVFIFQFYYIQYRSVSQAIINLLLTYALTHVLIATLTPLAARRIRHGFRGSLVIAVAALSLSFLSLGAAISGLLGNVSAGIILFALFSALYRTFYWIPYELSKEYSSPRHREWVEIVIALMPFAAGLYLTSGSMSSVYVLYGAAVLSGLSVIPLLSMRDMHEGYAWSYRGTFHQLFSHQWRSILWSSLFAGVEAATLFILWPIAIFTFLDWSYPLLGAVLSLTFIFTLVAKKLFNDAVSAVPRRVQPLVAASGWVMRLGVGGFIGAILVDTYFHTASRSSSRGLDMNSFEQIADNHTFVDEYSALKEIGMAIGRIAMCLLTVFFLSIFSLSHALALALIVTALAAAYSVHSALRPGRHSA